MKHKHWQDVVNLILGAWLIASPWIFGYGAAHAAAAGSVVLGLLLVAVACGAIFVPSEWEEWSEFVLGALTIIAPWVLGLGAGQGWHTNMVITGVIVLVLALWTLAVDPDYRGWAVKGTPG